MSIVQGLGPLYSAGPRGAIGAYRAWHASGLTFDEWLELYPFAGIYQKRRYGDKRMHVRMRFAWPPNPQTPAQQARRGVFADGVTHWQGLTSGEKAEYNLRAKRLRMSGFNLHQREWLATH